MVTTPRTVALTMVVVLGGPWGCRPSDILRVPPPATVTSSTAYANQAGAEAYLTQGRTQVFHGLEGGVYSGGLLPWSGLLGDEFAWALFQFSAPYANIDARRTVGGQGFIESGDQPLETLLQGRLTLLTAIPLLEQYEPASGEPLIGKAFAVIGYAELLAAEDYCGGVTLDALGSAKGVEYGTPLTTDSLLGVAEADFDSALAHAGGNDTVASLAAVGLGRARLNRGDAAAAATAVGSVPTSFVYAATTQPSSFAASPYIDNLYANLTAYYRCGYVNVVDRKGGNGLNYISAQDPRLVLSTSVGETCDGLDAGSADSVWYYPVKFGNPSTSIPLATGIEARLIQAEAALRANNVSVWAADLRALRADTTDTHVMFPPADSLPADSAETASPAAQVDLMFRERGFWLYGTGSRLGDMRRLIRQYGRDQSTVFPTGPYPNGNNPHLPTPLPNYGTDVSLTLPTRASGLTTPNPNYKGCTSSTKVA